MIFWVWVRRMIKQKLHEVKSFHILIGRWTVFIGIGRVKSAVKKVRQRETRKKVNRQADMEAKKIEKNVRKTLRKLEKK